LPTALFSQLPGTLNAEANDGFFAQLERVAGQLESQLRSIGGELTSALTNAIDFVLDQDWHELSPDLLPDQLAAFGRDFTR
jgi:hypothetical protein